MTIFFSINDVADFLAGGVLAIGNFDGVHLGHQALIKKVKDLKGPRPGAVLTFEPHPAKFFNPDQAHFKLSSPAQKNHSILRLGLDALIIHPLDADFLALSPKDFVDDVLIKKLKVKDVVVGDDFSFGAGAAGKIDDLRELTTKAGIEIHVVAPVNSDARRCSSTAIREFLEAGHLENARFMLGRPFSLRGLVEPDQKIGTALGFATANLKPKDFWLKRGVYASITRVYGENTKDFLSATNVGVRPSVSEGQVLVVETHCLEQLLELSQKEIEIFFIEYLREEKKFSALTALQEQVQKDFQAVRQTYRLHPAHFDVAS